MTSAAPIEFWFDFASPYAYFAALEIDDLAARHGRTVAWRPFMLGAAFKITGAQGLSRTPLKGDYARHDWRRIAELKGVPFVLPASHPSNALPATRAYYHLELRSPSEAAHFAKAIFEGYFGGRLDCGSAEDVLALAVSLGHDELDLQNGMANPLIKERALRMGEQAIGRGVFGSPWIFVEDEPFWGWDRLPMVERWLAGGRPG